MRKKGRCTCSALFVSIRDEKRTVGKGRSLMGRDAGEQSRPRGGRKETRQSTNSRLDSLFHILNISERLLTGTEPVIDCMKIETDYTDVWNRLEQMRSSSCRYLKSSLEDSGSTDL